MRLGIEHITHYQYDAPVTFALQQLRLTPKDRPGQQVVHRWSIDIEGGKTELQYADQNGNRVDLISVTSGAQELIIRCHGEVELLDPHGIVGQHRGPMPLWAFLRPTDLTEVGGNIRRLLAALGTDHENEISRAHALSAAILGRLPYEIGVTQAGTTAEAALNGRGGVCQDHAQIFIAAMRELGHPARYVSGYLKMDGQEQQDATHAWAEAHFDHIGWVGFDISNGQSPDERYVRMASGLDYQEAAPVRGMRYGQAQERLRVALQVQQ